VAALQVRYPEPWSKDLSESLTKPADERDVDFREAYEEALQKMNIETGKITDQVPHLLPPTSPTKFSYNQLPPYIPVFFLYSAHLSCSFDFCYSRRLIGWVSGELKY